MTVGTEPTTNGLYYIITDNTDASKATTIGVTDPTLNNLTVDSNGKLVLNDNSDDTTHGYFMFNPLEGSKVKIVVSMSNMRVNSKWSFVTFLDKDGNNIVLKTDANKKISYSLDNGTTMLSAGSVITASETFSITVDKVANTTTISYSGQEVVLNSVYNINGIKFTTAAVDTKSPVVNYVQFKTLA